MSCRSFEDALHICLPLQGSDRRDDGNVAERPESKSRCDKIPVICEEVVLRKVWDERVSTSTIQRNQVAQQCFASNPTRYVAATIASA